MASKVSQYIMTYRKIPFCLRHIDVGLHTFIFLFMTLAALQFRSSKNDILLDKFWTNMRNVWGIKAIFMAFWSAFSHKKEWEHLLEKILYTSRYSITQELLQLLDEFSFSYLFLLFFDRHPQLVCEHVKELNYMCHTQKEHVLPGL